MATNARVLLLRLSALGDILFALETLASLKAERPESVVDFVVEDRFRELLAGHPQIDRLLVFPRRRRTGIPGFVRELRRRRYDAVLDLHGILKSAWQVAVSRSRRKLGYGWPAAREGADRFYRQRVFLPDPLPHRADRGYFLLKAIGLQGRRAAPVLPDPERRIEFFEATKPCVVLHPGVSAFAEFKRWPVDRYAELARRLLDRGCSVAVSFGPGEAGLADAVRQRAPGIRSLDGGELGLVGLSSVLRTADLVVAADTGPLHLAAAAGSRVLALFGPKDPALYGPRGEGHQTLYHDVPCRPCVRRTCASPQCVLGLTVDRVEDAVHEALQRR